MPTTTSTAPPNAEVYARRFGALLRDGGWDVEIVETSWAGQPGRKGFTVPPKVNWAVRARRGTDYMHFSWDTVTEGNHTTRYRGGKLERPLAAKEAERRISLRTSHALSEQIAKLT